VVGMAIMRLIIGGLLRNMSSQNILILCLIFLGAGCLILQTASSYFISAAGLVAIGVGLAAGFPIVMGLVGNRYAALSGTAFSIVLFIALSGNMLLNYVMGFIVKAYGVEHLTTVSFLLWGTMVLLAVVIIKNNNTYQST
jgi:hypothetical protein